jgi:ABC-type Na+ transport system ATPase subunit NatA
VHAVDGVSFEVEQGEFFGILGPNGAGKTTTLEIIEGLREADGGEVVGDRMGAADAVTDDGVSLTIATHDPKVVLAGLAERNALTGLRVSGATLEDVFLELTGREYRA